MFAKTLHETKRHHVRLDVNGLGNPAQALGRIAEAVHRPDGGQQGFGAGALEAAPHPEHRLAAARNEQHPVLHRAGEIVLVHPAQDRGQRPRRLFCIHARLEAAQPVRQFRMWNLFCHIVPAWASRAITSVQSRKAKTGVAIQSLVIGDLKGRRVCLERSFSWFGCRGCVRPAFPALILYRDLAFDGVAFESHSADVFFQTDAGSLPLQFGRPGVPKCIVLQHDVSSLTPDANAGSLLAPAVVLDEIIL